jgi:hypothetical protein
MPLDDLRWAVGRGATATGPTSPADMNSRTRPQLTTIVQTSDAPGYATVSHHRCHLATSHLSGATWLFLTPMADCSEAAIK